MSEQTDVGTGPPEAIVPAARETEPGVDPPAFPSIGPYRLLQVIGEGGIGQVWLAEQLTPVRRQVAVKVIKAGMDTKEVVARFESERQALALMDHPAIAKVLDGGSTLEGRPYFVMEYVPGIPINGHCVRHKLCTAERLALFVEVCAGVQHAHQKAIIHRDLKPSNVLVCFVDGKAVPKIIDFGIAKAIAHRLTDKTLFTEVGAMIGTPEYMSPEQADLTSQDIDTRTDVYSLGVILYQLLCGELPFGSQELRSCSYEEMRRKLREIEPPRPSAKLAANTQSPEGTTGQRDSERRKLTQELQGDLDAITMKALEKDRRRRYDTPSELAADIRRYLQHQTVAARPPSRVYRIQKYVRRHRLGVLIASAAFCLLAAFATMMAFQARRIAREAEASRRVADFMEGMFSVSDPSEARGNAITAREILDKASRDIQGGLAHDPELQARLMSTMGLVYKNLGLYSQAEPLLEKALETRSRVLGPSSEQTLKSQNDWAELQLLEGRYAEVEPPSRETLKMARDRLGPDHAVTLESESIVARDLLMLGRATEAEQHLRELLEKQRRLYGADDARAIRSTNNLANALSHQQRFDEAVVLRAEVVERTRRVMGPDDPRTLSAMANLAGTQATMGNYAEAERIHLEILGTQRRVLGPEHPSTLLDVQNLATAYLGEGRFEDAEKVLLEALATEQRVRGPSSPIARHTRYNLVCVAARAGKRDRALAYLRDAVENGGVPPRMLDHMRTDPDLNTLRGDPEFEELASRLRQLGSARK